MKRKRQGFSFAEHCFEWVIAGWDRSQVQKFRVCSRAGREQVNFCNACLLFIIQKTVLGTVFSPLSNISSLPVNAWIVQKKSWLSQNQRVRGGSEQVKLHVFVVVTDEHMYRLADMCKGKQFFPIEIWLIWV